MRAAVTLALCTLACSTALAEPFVNDPGPQLYARFCASCHGAGGFGDGPVAPALKVYVPDLTRLARRSGNAFPEERVRRIIDGRDTYPVHGTRYMPVWGYEFRAAVGPEADEDDPTRHMIDRLVEHLRSMQQ